MKTICFLSALLFSAFATAQDVYFARNIVDTLTSEAYAGRGYVNNGHSKAANFIAQQFDEFGLERFDSDFKQEFTLNVNTFGGVADLLIDGKLLFAGVDFLTDPACPAVEGTFKLLWLNPNIVGNAKKMSKFTSNDLSNSFLIIDKKGITDKTQLEFMNNMIKNPFNAKGIIVVQDEKFTWGTAQQQRSYPILYVKRKHISYKNKKVAVKIEAKLKNDEISQNVLGYVKGSLYPDSFLVFSAHYDHLGMLGPDAVFTGANDNASGTAMLLNLAQHYSKPENKPKYSILFIAFGGEEAGLLGSKHYTTKPYFPLSQIKLVINTDIMGTGDDGIKVVNGSVHSDVFNQLTAINVQKGYLKNIGQRGKAANSDHHWFDEKGVKAIFIYTLGGSKAYHDIYDTADNLTLSKYNEVFKLLTDFVAVYK